MVKKIKNLTFILFITAAFAVSKVARAGIVPSCSGPDCNLSDVQTLLINIANWILGIVGSLALLMFVYGGVIWLISGGNSERVQKGTTIMRNAAIGIVIVLASYTIMAFILNAFGIDWSGGTIDI